MDNDTAQTTTARQCSECTRPATTRGMCGAHYQRWNRANAAGRAYPHMRFGGLPDRLLDILTIHGGWQSTSELAEHGRYQSVLRALIRLRQRGLVKSRPVRPRTRGWVENEWRAI